jgi:hypothetical protein
VNTSSAEFYKTLEHEFIAALRNNDVTIMQVMILAYLGTNSNLGKDFFLEEAIGKYCLYSTLPNRKKFDD